MKHEVTKQAAQGDLLVERVDVLPADATPAEDGEGPVIVAHSETGHHHVAIGRVKRFESNNPLIGYLSAADDIEIEHRRETDTHATLCLGPGIWRTRNQVEYTPEGLRRVED